jgi:hypothetical protein
VVAGEVPVERPQHRCYRRRVSPTIFRYRRYRFFFFSREEPRMHVHVFSPDGEAKFWIEPMVELAVNQGLTATELNELKHIVEERQNEIRDLWQRHFRT